MTTLERAAQILYDDDLPGMELFWKYLDKEDREKAVQIVRKVLLSVRNPSSDVIAAGASGAEVTSGEERLALTTWQAMIDKLVQL